MKPKKAQSLNSNDWDALPLDIQYYIALRIILRVELPRIKKFLLHFLHRVDLWLFPPVILLSAYITAYQYLPAHPIKTYAVLSIAFMSATLTLFLIRPRKWKRTAHWIKSHY